MKIGREALCALAGLLGGAWGCSLFFDVGELSQGAAESMGDAGGADAAGNGACRGTEGPSSIRVGNDAGVSFCIDTTEVTIAQYKRFLAAKPNASLHPIPECDFNKTFEPQQGDDGGPPPEVEGDRPVVYVDWCDAYAYCAWAGKRLCGRIGGGPASFEAPGDLSSQWVFACTQGGAHDYPYGNSFVPTACNDTTGGGPFRTKAVGKTANCEGGFPGLFDMSGNVEEWEDACEGAMCHRRGGSFTDTYDPNHNVFSCKIPYSEGGNSRAAQAEDVGIRCCSD